MDKGEKKLLVECISFEADPTVLKESKEHPSRPFQVQGVLQRKGKKNQNGRIYPDEILIREVQKYAQTFVAERRALGECVPAGTEIFTKSGWRNIEDIEFGDEVFTLNIQSDLLELQSVTNTIRKPYSDDMIHIYNSKIDMMVTKKHKVVLWDKYDKAYVLTAEELYEKIKNNDPTISHSYIKYSGKWIKKSDERFIFPGTDIKIKSIDWASFLGIFLAEGHCDGSMGGEKRILIDITRVKEENRHLIESLLSRLPFEYTISNNQQFIIKDQFLYGHLIKFGNSYTKRIPDYAKQWSVDLLNILFEWMLLGDGKNRKDSYGNLLREYCTTSPQLAEDVSEIILKMGNGFSTSIQIPENRIIENRIILAENNKPLHIVYEKTTKGICMDCRFLHADLVRFDDDVYCVTVPNSTWLMRYNGKVSWTHNCDHPESSVVNLKNVSHNIIEMHWVGDDLIGTIEVLTTPNGNILRELFRNGIKLGISSRGLGTLKKISEEASIVEDDFELIAFDFVSNPSTHGAFVAPVGKMPLAEGVVKNPITNRWEKTDDIVRNILLEIG